MKISGIRGRERMCEWEREGKALGCKGVGSLIPYDRSH